MIEQFLWGMAVISLALALLALANNYDWCWFRRAGRRVLSALAFWRRKGK